MKHHGTDVQEAAFTAAFVVSYEGNIFEADTPGQILTELTGTFFQDEEAITRWIVRGKYARHWLNTFAAEGRKAEIWSGKTKVETNYVKRYANDEIEDVEWSDDPAGVIDIETDRVLLRSLVELELLTILEREDVFYFRNGEPWGAAYDAGKTACHSCRYLRTFPDGSTRCVDKGVDLQHGEYVGPDAPVGWYCQSFAPLHAKDSMDEREGAHYVPISADMIHIPGWQVNYVAQE